MRSSVARLEHYLYHRHPGWINGEELFHDICKKTIPLGSDILEIGAGPSNDTSRFLATRGRLHGVDPDVDVLENDALTSAHQMRDGVLPFADGSMDHCVSHYVIEHVEHPAEHLREVSRVLRPGGTYIFRTPNRWHYVAFVASITPHWFHLAVANRLRGLPPESHDPYPTHYAMNNMRSIRRHATNSGFTVEKLEAVEKEPAYARFSAAAYLLLAGYERVVNSTPALRVLRANFFVVLRKRDSR